jgi:TPP-dependent pyruvate/acetoin dehydrogenase alpha subunit
MRAGNYRSENEINEWKKRDPIILLRGDLVRNRVLGESEVTDIEAQVAVEVAEAVEFARSSPFPTAEEAFEHVYANPFPIPH